MTAGETIYRVASFEVTAGNAETFKLSQIVVGDEDFAWWNTDYIATVDPYDGQDQYYTWDPDANDGAGGWFECDENCTVDSEKPANNVEFDPNMGFLYFTANGASLNIPSPIN